METVLVYWCYIGIMEKKMESTTVYWCYAGIMERMETTIVYWGYIGIVEWGYIGVMEKTWKLLQNILIHPFNFATVWRKW